MKKIKNFDARIAARSIYKIMLKMGVNPNKPSHDSWITDDSKEHAKICLHCNFIWCSVTEAGVSFYSSHATFPGWSKRSRCYKDFKKEMQHVLFYMR